MKDKQYYINCYYKTVDKAREELGDEMSYTFAEVETVDEIVGYYLVWHEDDFLETWLENLLLSGVKRSHDGKVTKILKRLSID